MELLSEFADVAKCGRIEGISVHTHESGNVLLLLCGYPIANKCFDKWHFHDGKQGLSDWLCAHIQRWLTSVRADWKLTSKCLEVMDVYGNIEFWDSGDCLEWHVSAALWAINQQDIESAEN